MSEAPNFRATERIAVVTGGNRGIGLEICRQLASKGVVVILKARDENKGAEAIDTLMDSGLSNYYVNFHQLNITDPSSIALFKDFIKARFGKLDILPRPELFQQELEIATQTYDPAEECINTNYYGPKLMTQELLPLLQLLDSPRIVNVSSEIGMLESVRNEWAIGMLSDSANLTEDKVDDVLNNFLKDFKEGLLETKNWPLIISAYTLSKAATNAYTRILAKKYPSFLVNCVCPGFVKTDMTCNQGTLTVEEGAESAVWLALLPKGGQSGKFFTGKEVKWFIFLNFSQS